MSGETRLYHRTTPDTADRILVSGFSDGPAYEEPNAIGGVWLADRPLDCNEGARGDVLLQVNLAFSDDELSDYELVEDGKPYREWCIPASILNGYATVLPVRDEGAL